MEKMDWHYSNNEGEILGIIACLRDYSGGEAIEVRTDSKIATNWAVKGWTRHHEKSIKKVNLLTATGSLLP